MTFEEFVAEHGIGMDAKLITGDPVKEHPMFHWQVSLTIPDHPGSLNLVYRMGSAHVTRDRDWFSWAPRKQLICAVLKRSDAGRWFEKVRGYLGHGQWVYFPKPPEAHDVLQCVALDSQGLEGNPTYEEWASEYGYDPDSREGERIFKACQEQARKLLSWLGYELTGKLIQCEEE